MSTLSFHAERDTAYLLPGKHPGMAAGTVTSQVVMKGCNMKVLWLWHLHAHSRQFNFLNDVSWEFKAMDLN